MKVLFPPWTTAKADEEKLAALHALAVDLLVQGVHADVSAAQMQLLTAKMPPKELAALKKQLLRPGFVEEWNSLDSLASGFAKALLAKDNQTPSASFKLFTSYDPEAVLWLGFTSKDAAVKDRFQLFLKVWPETRQRIPYALMQEMRIKPELPNYNEIVQAVFLELIDGKLATPEEMRAYLEPFSPPAPPPQVAIKRTRGKRGEAKVKDYEDEEESEDGLEAEEDLDDMGGEDDEIGLGIPIPKIDLEPDSADEGESDEADEEEAEADEEEAEPAPPKRASKGGKAAPSESPASVAKAPASAKKAESAPVAGGQSGKPHAASGHPAEAPGAAKAAVAKTPAAAPKPAAKTPANHAHGKPPAPSKAKPVPAKDAHKGKPAATKPEPKKSPAKQSKPAPKHSAEKSHASHHTPTRHPGASKPHKPSKPAPGKPSAKKH
jgi:hypothetical protein